MLLRKRMGMAMILIEKKKHTNKIVCPFSLQIIESAEVSKNTNK